MPDYYGEIKVDFERSTLTENNLGNRGPDPTSKRLMRFESVIAAVELPEYELPEGNTTMPINLIVTNTSFYDPSNSAQNRALKFIVPSISAFALSRSGPRKENSRKIGQT